MLCDSFTGIIICLMNISPSLLRNQIERTRLLYGSQLSVCIHAFTCRRLAFPLPALLVPVHLVPCIPTVYTGGNTWECSADREHFKQ